MLNRAKQFTEEKLGKAERTENDPQFEALAKRTDKIKSYTERLVKDTEAVLVPNPGKRYLIMDIKSISCVYVRFVCSCEDGDINVRQPTR